jgi:peptide-methionine (R)-S-oxide reductase
MVNTLTPEETYVIVHKGTEPPFSGEYDDFFEEGTYVCRRCEAPLYVSNDKFHSGCGWPSFDKTVSKDVITTRSDFKLGYRRTEVRCKRCGAHLGHVFDDGPTQTGLRYCMNSAAMKFVPAKDALSKDAKKGEVKDAKKDDSTTDGKAETKPAEATKETAKTDAAK